MRERKISFHSLARDLGIAERMLYRLITGERPVSRATALQIEHITQGDVPASAWKIARKYKERTRGT